MNAIKNGREETDEAPRRGAPNIGEGWRSRGTSEVCPWTYEQCFTQDNTYSSRNLVNKCSTYTYQQPGVGNVCVKWIRRPKSHTFSSCHHPSATLEKWRQWIFRSYFNGWRAMDAFIWPSDEVTECWMAYPSVTEEENCTALSGCSESHARHVLWPKRTWAVSSPAIWYDGSVVNITAHPCGNRWGRPLAVNSQICFSMEYLCSGKKQQLIAISMCKIWRNVGVKVLLYPPWYPDIAQNDYWLLVRVKENLRDV